MRETWTHSRWTCAAVVLLWSLFVQRFQWDRIYYAGDEPHYMMSVVSLLLDGDFNNLNNYQQRDYTRFGVQKLEPQWQVYGFKRPDIIPAEHGTVFPIMIAPAFAAAGLEGVRIFLIAIAIAGCLILREAIALLSGSGVAANLAGILLALSPTWQMQSSRIYPESTAGVMAACVLWILARDRVGSGTAFVAGFSTAFLPLMYTKYAAISIGLFVAILLLPDVRTRRTLWVGVALAIALGVTNAVVWAEQGAVTGNSSIHQPYLFSVSGWIARYWRPLFDRHHGIVPFQPYIFLYLWAAVGCLRLRENSRRHAVLFGSAISVLLYTVLHGIWMGGPGYSVPGRYLTATLPMMCGLIAVWSMQADRWRIVRYGCIATGALIAVAFYAIGMYRELPPYYVMWPYTYLFPRYWDSWDGVSKLEMRPVDIRDYLVPLSMLVVTKAIALWYSRPSATIRSTGP